MEQVADQAGPRVVVQFGPRRSDPDASERQTVPRPWSAVLGSPKTSRVESPTPAGGLSVGNRSTQPDPAAGPLSEPQEITGPHVGQEETKEKPASEPAAGAVPDTPRT